MEDQEYAEADVSTKEEKENAHSRFSGAHSYKQREKSAQGAAPQGPSEVDCYTRVGQEAELEGKLAAATTQIIGVAQADPWVSGKA